MRLYAGAVHGAEGKRVSNGLMAGLCVLRSVKLKGSQPGHCARIPLQQQKCE